MTLDVPRTPTAARRTVRAIGKRLPPQTAFVYCPPRTLRTGRSRSRRAARSTPRSTPSRSWPTRGSRQTSPATPPRQS
jgi:hypothetical protein